MIIDSEIWKYELKKEITEFENFLRSTDLNSNNTFEINDENYPEEYSQIGMQTFMRLQKFCIYSAIIIRKLIESNKISDELEAENFCIIKYLKYPDSYLWWMNSHQIEKLYELGNPIKTNINIKSLTDKIIHSYHFMPNYIWKKIDETLHDEDMDNWKNDGLEGIYFSSDKSKDKDILYITTITLIDIIKKVIDDNIIQKTYHGDQLVLKSRKS